MKPTTSMIAAIVGAAALAGCAGASSARPDCGPLPAADIEAINTGGLDGWAISGPGATLPLPDDLAAATYTRVAIGNLVDPEGKSSHQALFVLGPEGRGPIMPADERTQQRFEWGSAAADGSPVDQWRDSVRQSQTMTDLKRCPTT